MGKYKKENGTTRVGDALRWLLKQGKEVAPELLKIASNVTGIEALELLANKISTDTERGMIPSKPAESDLNISDSKTRITRSAMPRE